MPEASFAFGGGGSISATPAAQLIEESTPWVAAGDGDLALLRTALGALNLPPSAADSNGFTFVHAAAAYCQLDVLRWLFAQEEVNVNAGDTDGDTPLHHCDDADAARVLVEEGGADVAIRNDEGKTAREAKEEELKEAEEEEEDDDDDDSDDEDREKLKELVRYLKGLEGGGGSGKDEDMQS